uniref:PhoLip_ATPase_C domain-containing protein n=1 Tax=Elaeophora elaphi TaxID=1147741 RepID=A0A0R3S4T7_9BILA
MSFVLHYEKETLLQLFVFVIFWYQFFDGFSGSLPMDPIYTMLYPIIFTGIQPLIFGIYDQVAKRECLQEKPELYNVCRTNKVSTIYLRNDLKFCD